MRHSIPLAYIGTPPNTYPIGGQYPGFISLANYGGGTSAYSVSTLLLSPLIQKAAWSIASANVALASSYALSQAMEAISSCFTKWRVVGDHEFEYLPLCSTGTATDFAFCFMNDPHHPVNGFRAYGCSNTNPNYTTVLTGQNNVAFSAWLPWRRRFSSTHGELTVFNNAVNDRATQPAAQTTFWSAMSAADRESFEGAITCQAGSASIGTSSVSYGLLKWNVDIEYFGFDPVQTSIVTPTLMTERASAHLARQSFTPNIPSSLHSVLPSGPIPASCRPAILHRSSPRGTDDDDEGKGGPIPVDQKEDFEEIPPSRPRYPPTADPGGSLYVPGCSLPTLSSLAVGSVPPMTGRPSSRPASLKGGVHG
jgi:hypothetical protein